MACWIPIYKGEVGYSAGDFRCTNCGKPNPCYSLTEYCARCGAKMEKPANLTPIEMEILKASIPQTDCSWK